jgi:hypothetical protein
MRDLRGNVSRETFGNRDASNLSAAELPVVVVVVDGRRGRARQV